MQSQDITCSITRIIATPPRMPLRAPGISCARIAWSSMHETWVSHKDKPMTLQVSKHVDSKPLVKAKLVDTPV